MLNAVNAARRNRFQRRDIHRTLIVLSFTQSNDIILDRAARGTLFNRRLKFTANAMVSRRRDNEVRAAKTARLIGPAFGMTKDNEGHVRPLMPRTFTSLSQAEEEKGQSRIYLGIHWAFD